MPKLKTNKGARKRFRLNASGKVKRKKAFLRHILTSKTSHQKRGLRQGTFVDRVDAKGIKRLLPYG